MTAERGSRKGPTDAPETTCSAMPVEASQKGSDGHLRGVRLPPPTVADTARRRAEAGGDSSNPDVSAVRASGARRVPVMFHSCWRVGTASGQVAAVSDTRPLSFLGHRKGSRLRLRAKVLSVADCKHVRRKPTGHRWHRRAASEGSRPVSPQVAAVSQLPRRLAQSSRRDVAGVQFACGVGDARTLFASRALSRDSTSTESDARSRSRDCLFKGGRQPVVDKALGVVDLCACAVPQLLNIGHGQVDAVGGVEAGRPFI